MVSIPPKCPHKKLILISNKIFLTWYLTFLCFFQMCSSPGRKYSPSAPSVFLLSSFIRLRGDRLVSGKGFFTQWCRKKSFVFKSVSIFIRLRGISDGQWERFLLVSQKMASKYPQIALKNSFFFKLL